MIYGCACLSHWSVGSCRQGPGLACLCVPKLHAAPDSERSSVPVCRVSKRMNGPAAQGDSRESSFSDEPDSTEMLDPRIPRLAEMQSWPSSYSKLLCPRGQDETQRGLGMYLISHSL